MWQWTLWHLIGHPKNVYATISFHSLFNRRPTERSVILAANSRMRVMRRVWCSAIALHRVNFGPLTRSRATRAMS